MAHKVSAQNYTKTRNTESAISLCSFFSGVQRDMVLCYT